MEWKFSTAFKKSESTSFPRRPLACTVGEGAAAGNLEVWAQNTAESGCCWDKVLLQMPCLVRLKNRPDFSNVIAEQ